MTGKDNDYTMRVFVNTITSIKTGTSILIILSLGFLVFSNILLNGFVGDDIVQVSNNTQVQSLHNIPNFFLKKVVYTSTTKSTLAQTYYKPILTTTYTVINTIFLGFPLVFHFLQLLLHPCNVVLLFLLFKRFFTKPLALFLSLIFLVHPLNEEAVSYIADLQDVLFFFFGMLGLLLVTHTNRLRWIFLSGLLVLLSILSKETGLLFFIIVPVYIFIKKRTIFLKSAVIFTGFLLIYAAMRFATPISHTYTLFTTPMLQTPLSERFLSMPKIIWYYLQNVIYPTDIGSSHLWVVKTVTTANFYLPLFFDILFFSVVIGGGTILFWKYKKLFPMYCFFLLWFFIGLVAHLQLIPLDLTVATRWFYFPMAGLLGIIACFISIIKIKNQPVIVCFLLLAIGIIALFSLRTFLRNFDFKDNLTLYQKDLTFDPNNYILEDGLGVELYNEHQYAAAKTHFLKSTELNPATRSWNNLAVLASLEGNRQQDKYYLEKSIQLYPQFNLAYINLAKYYYANDGTIKAKQFTDQALKKFPDDEDLLHLDLVFAVKLQQKEEAKRLAAKIYQLNPTPGNFQLYQSLQ